MLTTTRYEGVFHAVPEQVAQVRAGVRECLAGCPAAGDAVLIISELAANSVLHSRSRGQHLTVRCEVFPDYIWLEVEDLGGPWHPRQRDGRPTAWMSSPHWPARTGEPSRPATGTGSPGQGWTSVVDAVFVVIIVILLAVLRREHRKVRELRAIVRKASKWLNLKRPV